MANIQGGTNYAGAGATTLSALIPIIYEARDKVAREPIGLIHAATRDASESQAAVGQTVRSPVTQAATLTAITPSNVVPNTGGQTLLYKDLVIADSWAAPVQWTGEEQRAVGDNYEVIARDQFSQAFRVLDNKIEASLVNTMVAGCSRAYGNVLVSPFTYVANSNSSMLPFAELNLILDNNGTPDGNRALILGNRAMANVRAMPNLYKANEAGTDELLRLGAVMEVDGFKFYKSGQLDKNGHTAGTGTGYVTDGTGAASGSVYQAGETAIKVKTGANVISAGDTVTFAGDTNVYVVASGVTAAGQTLTLAAPGLQQSAADSVAITVGASYSPNIAFDPTALILASRAPIMPVGGDAATDVAMVLDAISGISYQIAQYKVYRQVHFEVGQAWGSLANKPEFAAMLIGN